MMTTYYLTRPCPVAVHVHVPAPSRTISRQQKVLLPHTCHLSESRRKADNNDDDALGLR